MNDATLYITDKSGQKFYTTLCGFGYHQGELNNMRRRLACIKADAGYITRIIDQATAKWVVENEGSIVETSDERITQDDLDLLAELDPSYFLCD